MSKLSIGWSGTIAVSLTALGLAAGGLQAGTCTSQPSNLAVSGTIIQSDGVNERAAENIALTNTDFINGFCWRGVYVTDPDLDDCSGSAVDNFTIKVYSSTVSGAGQCFPDQLLATFVQGVGPANVTVTRTQVDEPFPGIFEYEWVASINDVGNALQYTFGTCLWIEITAPDQGAACTFFLSLADNTETIGDGNCLVDTNNAYTQEDLVPTDLAVGVTTVLGDGLIENADVCNLNTCVLPLNDDCADFVSLSGNVVDFPFFNFNATNDGPIVPADCPGQQSDGAPEAIGADIWYRWTPTSTGPAQITLCESAAGYDAVLVVYSNNTCPASTIVACDDDGCGGGQPSFVILDNVVSGDPMLLRIGGWKGSTTLNGVLNITSGGPGACCFIAQGTCAQATEVDGSDCTAAGGLYQGVGTLCESIECTPTVCTAEEDDPSQLPIPTQGGATSATVFTVADNVVLNANDTITGVCVWGGHRVGVTSTDCGNDPGGGSPNTWRVRFYGTTIVDGTPIPNTAAILNETTVNDPPRVATGNFLTDNNIAEYSYHITLTSPFAATANACYWLEVKGPEDLTVTLGSGCRFRWEGSDFGDGTSFQPANPDVNGYAPGDAIAFDPSWVLETTGSAGLGNLTICTPAPFPFECGGGFDTLTESAAGNISAGGVACQAGGISTANTYARTTNVGAAPFEVCSVEFAVGNSGAPLETTVNLYSDPNGGAPSLADGLVLLGSESFQLATTGNTLASIPFDPPICVAANTQLVIEWVIPASTDGFASYAANNFGEDSATFILSPDCAINDYTTMADIGFPDSHWVLGVCGDAGACDGQCAGQKDTCPADIAPAAGGDCLADGDGSVGAPDLGELLANWGTPTNPCADLAPPGAPNGEVNAADLGELLANWGQCV